MIKRYGNNVSFDTVTSELTIYDSSKPYPHCRTTSHINDTSINSISHLDVDDVLELLSCTTGPAKVAKMPRKWKKWRSTRDKLERIERELLHDWKESCERSDVFESYKKYAEREHYNQYCLLYKK